MDPSGHIRGLCRFGRGYVDGDAIRPYSHRPADRESFDDGLRHDAFADGVFDLQLETHPRRAASARAGRGMECGEKDGGAVILERYLHASRLHQPTVSSFNAHE